MGIFLAVSLACAQMLSPGARIPSGVRFPAGRPGIRAGNGRWGMGRDQPGTVRHAERFPSPGHRLTTSVTDLPPGATPLATHCAPVTTTAPWLLPSGPRRRRTGPFPGRSLPDPGDDGAFYWRQTARDGQPLADITQGKDHRPRLFRAGNDSPYVT